MIRPFLNERSNYIYQLITKENWLFMDILQIHGFFILWSFHCLLDIPVRWKSSGSIGCKILVIRGDNLELQILPFMFNEALLSCVFLAEASVRGFRIVLHWYWMNRDLSATRMWTSNVCDWNKISAPSFYNSPIDSYFSHSVFQQLGEWRCCWTVRI